MEEKHEATITQHDPCFRSLPYADADAGYG